MSGGPKMHKICSDPLDCEFGDAILDSEWGEKMTVIEAAPFQHRGFLFNGFDKEETDASPYKDLMLDRTTVEVNGKPVLVWFRTDPEELDHESEWTEGEVITNEEREKAGFPPYSGPNPLPV